MLIVSKAMFGHVGIKYYWWYSGLWYLSECEREKENNAIYLRRVMSSRVINTMHQKVTEWEGVFVCVIAHACVCEPMSVHVCVWMFVRVFICSCMWVPVCACVCVRDKLRGIWEDPRHGCWKENQIGFPGSKLFHWKFLFCFPAFEAERLQLCSCINTSVGVREAQ